VVGMGHYSAPGCSPGPGPDLTPAIYQPLTGCPEPRTYPAAHERPNTPCLP
jgi:hypothetical protein